MPLTRHGNRQPPLGPGDHMPLRPEDVNGVTSSSFYASVTRVRRTTVDFEALGGEEISVNAVQKDVADARRVPAEEAIGDHPGVWLRRSVRFGHRRATYYGQVTAYDGTKLSVSTRFGAKTVALERVHEEVYPVIAMVLGSQRWPQASWPTSRLRTPQDQILTRLMEGDNGSPWTIQAWLSEWHHELGDLSDLRHDWVDPGTGTSMSTSLRHVAWYTFYMDSNRGVPPIVRNAIGTSFCDEPSITPPGRPDDNPSDAGFFDPLADDDSDAGDGVPPDDTGGAPSRLLPDRTRLPGSTDGYSARPRLVLESYQPPLEMQTLAPSTPIASQDIELIDLIQKHKPHLLPHYFSRGSGQSEYKRCRDETGAVEPLPKRARAAFQPTSDQERVHELFTAEVFRGKSSESFFEYVLASPLMQLNTHPGAVGRMCDLRYGRGLSIKHFRRVSFLEKIRNGGADTQDFTAAAPTPRQPISWTELGSTARSFVDYSRAMCDAITIEVAEALDQFISALEGWQQCAIADLPLVFRWIDSLLKRYRDAATHDVFHLTTTRGAAASWFSISNPELHSLMFTALGGRLKAAEARSASTKAPSARESARTSSDRRIPGDVTSEIRRQGDKEVCLHFLSNRGCKSQDPDKCTFKTRAHFWPATIPARLRQYITNHLGSLRKPFQVE